MNDERKSEAAELTGEALTDEELDHASGGGYRVIHSIGVFACDACMVWLENRPGAVLVHKKCGKEMRRLQTAAEKQSVREQYQKVSSSEAIIS